MDVIGQQFDRVLMHEAFIKCSNTQIRGEKWVFYFLPGLFQLLLFSFDTTGHAAKGKPPLTASSVK